MQIKFGNYFDQGAGFISAEVFEQTFGNSRPYASKSDWNWKFLAQFFASTRGLNIQQN